MPLTRVISKLNNIARIEVGPIIQSIFQEGNIQDEIIRLNTIDQLFEKGENSLGIRLENIGGPYSQATVQIKQEKGQPTDRITLRDKGDFYNSWEVIANTGDTYITIKVDPWKAGPTNLLDEWGVEVVGLNKENTIWLINEIRTKMVAKIKAYILAA
jgi:hypothetical protein